MEKEQFDTKLKMVLYFLRGTKRYFFAFILFACLMSILDLINPKIISFTVDSVLGNTKPNLSGWLSNVLVRIGGITWLRQNLWFIALVVIGMALLSAVCRFLFRYLNAKGSEKLVHHMRNELFSHLLDLPFSWYSQNHTGDIIQRCTSDVEQIKNFLADQLTSLFRVVVLISIALYFMFSIHVKLALVALVFIPIIVGYSLFFHNKMRDEFMNVDVEEGKLSSIAQENLTGVRVVRAFGKEMYERQRFEKQNKYYTSFWTRLMKTMSIFWTSSDLFSYLQVICVVAYASVLCVHGELSPGNFIAFNSYTTMIIWPIRSLGRVISNLSRAGVSIDRLRYIMNAKVEQDSKDAKDIDLFQDITFDHVFFRYENNAQDVLHDVSFKVKAGSTIGILGGTGSGKSTLVYLLNRLYELNKGHIYIGDTDISQIKLSCLRKNIGMVLQEPYLFSRTLEDNIAIAKEESGHEDVQQAAKIASLDSAISHFKDGYNTFVGERGVTLSGGQKQRTAIAQMLIRKAPIMIFDDSLSAVDAKTDALIRQGLKENVKNSTIFLIAHRITTLMDADYILVLNQGKIVQRGTPEQLLQEDGIYKRIYDIQLAKGVKA